MWVDLALLLLKNSFSFEFPLLDGDLGAYGSAKGAYMKQKHRMIWERRHGPVGSGIKVQPDQE